ncbi:hypothetical protein WN48_01503 [Eufriesea mexicana]|nr:hypothetical protein WN48_01503 [Eufriesea mexicana]
MTEGRDEHLRACRMKKAETVVIDPQNSRFVKSIQFRSENHRIRTISWYLGLSMLLVHRHGYR